ncbi:MAG: tetratricopeptide repeat protein [Patescibacteria group bacterium]|nr:tetratricopeptide repeat protein [Patescibacteria group bacterium]
MQKSIILIYCLILAFLIFGITLQNGFVFDDMAIVRDNLMIRNLANIPQFFNSPYSSLEAGIYRPITILSFSLNYFLFTQKSLWGQMPAAWSFHFINIILHALNCWLLFLLIKQITKQKLLPYLTALFFLILPIHTEAVTGIVGRAELLALCFSLLSLLSFLCFKSNLKKILFGGLTFLLALLSKENAAAVIPIYIFIAFYFVILSSSKHSFWQKVQTTILNFWREFLVLFVTFGIYLIMRFSVLKEYLFGNNSTMVENPLDFAPVWQRILTSFKVLCLYLEKSFWPINLSSDYSYNQIPLVTGAFDWRMLIGLIAFLFLIFCLFWPIKKQNFSLFGLASIFFLFPFLPIANLFFPIGTIMAERLMYFPSIGLCLFLAIILSKLYNARSQKNFKPLFFIIVVGLTVFYGARSFARNKDWYDEKTLFFSAAQASPNSVLSRSNKGAIYLLDGNYDKALEETQAANKIYPFYPPAMNNLGLLYYYQQQYDLAEKQFLKTIAISPGYANAYENLALIYFNQERYQDAKNILLKRYLDHQDLANQYLLSLFEDKINSLKSAGQNDKADKLTKDLEELKLN